MDRGANLLRIDYEIVNGALGLELNTALAPETIRHIVRTRLPQLTREERSSIPDKIMELVCEIAKTEAKPRRGRTHKVDFEYTTDDAILIKSGTPEDQLRIIVGSNRWAEWSHANNARITQTEAGIVIESAALSNNRTDAVRTLLREFGI